MLLGTLLLVACSSDSAKSANEKASQAAGSEGQAIKEPRVSGPAAGPDGTSLGQLQTAEHIDLNLLVNKTPAEVEAVLGSAQDMGSDRVSCVRFVPERVFFACEQEIRVYQHPPFEQIRVEFEDGRAANVTISGLPGEGKFDLDAGLASVGVVLPDPPSHDNPPLGVGGDSGDVVDRWEWPNDRARLRVDGLEYRVRLSVVNSEYRRAKLEVINNNPLSAEQAARIKPVKGSESASSVSEPPN
jgi:hypothetical protein